MHEKLSRRLFIFDVSVPLLTTKLANECARICALIVKIVISQINCSWIAIKVAFLFGGVVIFFMSGLIKKLKLWLEGNLVPRSLVDEAEGEIWPNPICITSSPVRNVTGEASAHA